MITVIVIAKNEEERIEACLESVKWADEIIVCDNGSTDKTLDLAKKYTNKIVIFNKEDFAAWRNKATEQASGDWILYIDPDERVLASLKEEILELVKKGEKSAYAISRRNIIFGREVKYGPFWPDWVIRLIKKDELQEWVGKVHEYPKFKGKLGYTKNSLLHLTHRGVDQIVLKSLEWSKIDAHLRLEANHPKMSGWRFLRIFVTEIFNQGIKKDALEGWVGKVHEYPKFTGKLGYTKNSLLHLTHRGVDQIVLKSLEWSKIDANLRLEAGHPKMSGWRFLRIFITEIFNQGIKRGGFFNGTIGIMDSLLQVFSMYMTYIRLWELQQGKPLEKTYEELDKKLITENFKY